jgi:hypothetical protein
MNSGQSNLGEPAQSAANDEERYRPVQDEVKSILQGLHITISKNLGWIMRLKERGISSTMIVGYLSKGSFLSTDVTKSFGPTMSPLLRAASNFEVCERNRHGNIKSYYLPGAMVKTVAQASQLLNVISYMPDSRFIVRMTDGYLVFPNFEIEQLGEEAVMFAGELIKGDAGETVAELQAEEGVRFLEENVSMLCGSWFIPLAIMCKDTAFRVEGRVSKQVGTGSVSDDLMALFKLRGAKEFLKAEKLMTPGSSMRIRALALAIWTVGQMKASREEKIEYAIGEGDLAADLVRLKLHMPRIASIDQLPDFIGEFGEVARVCTVEECEDDHVLLCRTNCPSHEELKHLDYSTKFLAVRRGEKVCQLKIGKYGLPTVGETVSGIHTMEPSHLLTMLNILTREPSRRGATISSNQAISSSAGDSTFDLNALFDSP